MGEAIQSSLAFRSIIHGERFDKREAPLLKPSFDLASGR